MKQFKIKLSQWGRGGNNGSPLAPSMLENDLGFRCCLGFLAVACGADPKGHYMPHEIPKLRRELPQLAKPATGFRDGFTVDGFAAASLAFDIAKTNDSKQIDDETRKAELAPLFEQIGWEPVYEE